VGVLCGFAGLILLMVAMAGDGWFRWIASDGKTELRTGLKQYTHYDYHTATTVTRSGKLASLGSDYPEWSYWSSNLDEGGTDIVAAGVVTIVITLGSLVLIVLHLVGKVAATKMYLGIVGFLVSVGLILLAIILYSRKIFIGYSFLLFLLGGFISVFAWLFALSAFPSEDLKRPRLYFSLCLVAVLVTFIICGMSTTFWFAQEWTEDGDSGSNNFGLVRYLLLYTTASGYSGSESGTFQDFYNRHPGTNDQVHTFESGGKTVIGFGVVALVATACSTVCMIISLIKPHPQRSRFMVASVIFMLTASILYLIGVSVYAYDLWISWSFMLYLGCALLLLAAVLALIKATLEGEKTPTTTTARTSTTTRTSAPRPPPSINSGPVVPPPPVSSGGAYDHSDFATIVGADAQVAGASGDTTHFRYT